MHLTQETAETLIQIEKILLYPINIHIPQSNHQNEIYPLGYTEENKIFDTKTLSATMFRGSKNPKKVSYKILYKDQIRLIGLDLFGTRHINFDDGKIFERDTPHLHIYDELNKDKKAYSLPPEFSNTDDIIQTLKDFLSFSNVINVNEIEIVHQRGVFDDR